MSTASSHNAHLAGTILCTNPGPEFPRTVHAEKTDMCGMWASRHTCRSLPADHGELRMVLLASSIAFFWSSDWPFSSSAISTFHALALSGFGYMGTTMQGRISEPYIICPIAYRTGVPACGWRLLQIYDPASPRRAAQAGSRDAREVGREVQAHAGFGLVSFQHGQGWGHRPAQAPAVLRPSRIRRRPLPACVPVPERATHVRRRRPRGGTGPVGVAGHYGFCPSQSRLEKLTSHASTSSTNHDPPSSLIVPILSLMSRRTVPANSKYAGNLQASRMPARAVRAAACRVSGQGRHADGTRSKYMGAPSVSGE